MSKLTLSKIEPTVCLEEGPGGLRQLVRVTVVNEGEAVEGSLVANGAGADDRRDACPTGIGRVPSGESTHDFFLPEVQAPGPVEWVLQAGGEVADRQTVAWQPPRKLTVHVVQRSHHDVGYTDLGSQVLPEMARSLDDALDMADATDSYPDDARFRITIEQVWSLWEFLRTSKPAQVERMLDRLRGGRFEMTAFFGNMTPELCGSEALARTLYHAARLQREYGLPAAISAEHNDVPGLSWGQAQVLVDGGIKLFSPGMPYYWSWSKLYQLQSFWDEATIFPRGTPGAFWWEAPAGGRVLVWYNGTGCNGDCRGDLPDLAGRLGGMLAGGYPYASVRWTCGGGARDNAPYIIDYANTIKAWNERWAWPRLICSTNARFYADFAAEVPADLPVWRGELPGQDYPVGATSTAAATAVNRNNHADLPAAETLATAASCLTDYPYQAASLWTAYEEVLWHDEHTWGHSRPAGPGAVASEVEKAAHAYRAAALSHDVASKALAQISDRVKLAEAGFHLCVFNPEPGLRTGLVRVPLREIYNANTGMQHVTPEEDPAGTGYWRGVPLVTRGHADPPPELVAGQFSLVDVASGETVAHALVDLTGPRDTELYASQRMGIVAGGPHCGMLDRPDGLGRDLCFVAREVPGCGWRTYRLAPLPEGPVKRSEAGPLCAHAEGGTGLEAYATVENEFFRIEVDETTGAIRSLYDKAQERELVDAACPHGFGALVVRGPQWEGDRLLENVAVRVAHEGPGCAGLEISGTAHGHPQVTQTITLYDGLAEVHLSTRLLQDGTPLLETSLAFPFRARETEWRYEANFSTLDPATDLLPGAYWNRLTVQNWVRVRAGGQDVLWSSLDAPVVSLAGLWPDYLSPAHRCHVDERLERPPVAPEALRENGWIYSCVAANNFGTNFACSQSGEMLFRYVIGTRAGEQTTPDPLSSSSAVALEATLPRAAGESLGAFRSDAEAVRWGRKMVRPMTAMFTDQPRAGTLPPSAAFLEVGSEEVALLACKRAEDGRGLILRLWNLADREVSVPVRFPLSEVAEARVTNLVEEEAGPEIPCAAQGFTVAVAARGTATVRVILSQEAKL